MNGSFAGDCGRTGKRRANGSGAHFEASKSVEGLGVTLNKH